MLETFYHCAHHDVRLALVTDLHDRPHQKVLDSLRYHHPDIIAIGGDLIVANLPQDDMQLKMHESPYALAFLKACAAMAPTYYSLGNHEWMLHDDDLLEIKKTKAILLDNTYQSLSLKNVTIHIGGLSAAEVSYYRQGYKQDKHQERYLPEFKKHRHDSIIIEPELDWLSDFSSLEGIKILLNHHPEYFPILKDYPIDYILCGHAHGGQIRFYDFFHHQWRGLFAPQQGLFPKYTEGMHQGPYGKMIISRGLSNTAPLIPRLFNPLELVYIDI